MKSTNPAIMLLFCFAVVFTVFLNAGCEIGETTSDVVIATPTPSPAANRTTDAQDEASEDESSSNTTSKPSPTTTPATAPATQPVSSSGGFLWQPSGDSVKVVIPADMPHWQMHVFSRRKHATLYGPDNRGGNREENIVYTLPGSGKSWSDKSLRAGDDGTLLVFINTRDAETGAYKSAGWRIMNPSAAQSGNGNRIQPGENK